MQGLKLCMYKTPVGYRQILSHLLNNKYQRLIIMNGDFK